MPKTKTKAKTKAKTAQKKKLTTQERKQRTFTIRRIVFAGLVLIAILAALYFLIIRPVGDTSIAENGIGSAFTRIQLGVTNAVGSVRNFFTRWHNYDTLEAEYNALYQENMQLSLELTNADEAIAENERLTDLLDAKSRYDSLDPIYAKIIARDAGQWFETFSINRGTSDGVFTGAAVVNGDGLIGRVYETGLNYAKVLCIIDPRSALACIVQRTRDNGILKGEMSSESDTAECYVYYLPNLNNISPGDTVVTSGTDSLFPKGIKIGIVSAVCLDAGSEGSYAVVSLAADFQHLEEVLVLREVVETDTDILPSTVTVTPEPKATTGTASATPTPSPTPEVEIWTYPTAGTDSSTLYENLPEDDWARE